MFIAVVSRPDIAFATSFVSRFLSNYNKACWDAVKKILRYLSGTKSVGIMYRKNKFDVPVSYNDADYAGDSETRKLMSGCMSFLAGGPVIWSSRSQDCVALSTTESEFIAASETVKDIVWLQKLLTDIGYEHRMPVDLRIDNQGAMRLAKNPEFHKRTKHVHVRYCFIRDMCEKNIVNVTYIKSEDQVADILTKPLVRVRFEYLRDRMNVRVRESNSGESVETI